MPVRFYNICFCFIIVMLKYMRLQKKQKKILMMLEWQNVLYRFTRITFRKSTLYHGCQQERFEWNFQRNCMSFTFKFVSNHIINSYFVRCRNVHIVLWSSWIARIRLTWNLSGGNCVRNLIDKLQGCQFNHNKGIWSTLCTREVSVEKLHIVQLYISIYTSQSNTEYALIHTIYFIMCWSNIIHGHVMNFFLILRILMVV